jgi:hypothetical protein
MSSEEKNLLLAIVGDLGEVFPQYWGSHLLPIAEDHGESDDEEEQGSDRPGAEGGGLLQIHVEEQARRHRDREKYLMRQRRQGVINKLLGDRFSWDSSRHFEFCEYRDCYFSDYLHISLYSNGIGALYWNKGNCDHSSNDHRVGLFEENGDVTELRSISLWREFGNIAVHSFRKLEDGSLLYSDQDPDGRLVESKVLELSRIKSLTKVFFPWPRPD